MLYRTENVASSGSLRRRPARHHLILAARPRPALRRDIPDRLVRRIDIHRHRLALAGRELDLLVRDQPLPRLARARGSVAYTSATSAPAREPVFVTVSVTDSPSLPTFRFE